MINTDKNLLEALITKYGKPGVNLAINRLNESQESKSIDAAKKLLIDNGYTPERADKFIRIDLRNDFPILRDKKSGKFILGITRMFLRNELRDARTISQLNTTLKYISDESHYDEYDRNLNNETAKTLIGRFNIEVEKDIEKSKDKISSKNTPRMMNMILLR